MSIKSCLATLLLAGCAALPSVGPVKVRDGALVDLASMSLYVFDRDTEMNRSSCDGACARNWPPLAADADAVPVGQWYVIKRSDSVWQWAYKGKPVYLYAKDQKPGDRLGDGVNGLWHLARP
ncbi:MAG TPA: hypothetical protein VLA16_17060 [Ideonella sp.]|nr:hypothetical protein [Ideonella sp.]